MVQIQNKKQNIPTGWQESKLLDCLRIPSKLAGIKLSEYEKEGDFPVFDQGQDYISGFSSNKGLVVNDLPAILFGDHTRIVKYIRSPFVVGADGTKIFWAKDGFDSTFLYYLVLKQKIPNTGYNRHFKFFKDIKVLVPESKKEQQKIAEILGTVDEDIAKTQEVIEATEKLKRGLMQQLFTRGLDDGISELELGKISKVTSSKRIMRSEYVENGVPFYRSKEIIEKAKGIKHDSIFYISQERFDEIEKKFGAPHIGDILITAVGTIGVVYLVDEEGFYFKDGNLLWIKDIDKSLDKSYLKYYMNSEIFQKRVLGTAIGSNQKALTIEKVEKVIVPIPKLPEQQKIAEILSAVDEKISVNKELKGKLILLKKGLMSDLLSGNVRVN